MNTHLQLKSKCINKKRDLYFYQILTPSKNFNLYISNMLKRLLHSVIVLLYFVVATGFTVNVHYCGDKLENVSLFSKKSCCDEDMSESGCCKDEVKSFNIKDKHIGEDQSDLSFNSFVIFPAKIKSEFAFNYIQQEIYFKKGYYPPPLFSNYPSIHLKNRVLII